MKKEIITQSQAISAVAMYTMGSNLIFGLGRKSMQDTWISMLIALAASLPVFYMYGRIMKRYPGLNVFEICEAALGKVAGKIAIVLFSWYCFHAGFLVMRNFSEYIQVRIFNQMPQTITLLSIAVLSMWVTKRGVEALGRCAIILIPVALFIIVGTTAMLAKDFHASYLLPIGGHIDKVPEDAFHNFALPLVETVVFLGLLKADNRSNPGKTIFLGALIGWAALLLAFFRNSMSLGFPSLGEKWFPSYDATSLIIIGSFISRIENIFGVNVFIAVFIKIAVCLLAAANGAAKLCNADDYRPYVAPIGLMMVAFASIAYKSVLAMFDFLDVFPYYSIPFEIILPLTLCIAAEIRFLVRERKGKGGADTVPAEENS